LDSEQTTDLCFLIGPSHLSFTSQRRCLRTSPHSWPSPALSSVFCSEECSHRCDWLHPIATFVTVAPPAGAPAEQLFPCRLGSPHTNFLVRPQYLYPCLMPTPYGFNTSEDDTIEDSKAQDSAVDATIKLRCVCRLLTLPSPTRERFSIAIWVTIIYSLVHHRVYIFWMKFFCNPFCCDRG
jgi:hypothetical protein